MSAFLRCAREGPAAPYIVNRLFFATYHTRASARRFYAGTQFSERKRGLGARWAQCNWVVKLRGYEGRFGRGREELAEVTILFSYLLISLAISGALLWVLMHRGSAVRHDDRGEHWDPM
jgi:hypothetical protein